MDRRDEIIEELRALVAKLTAQVEAQAKRISELELALAKSQKNSATSSKPPSSDIINPPPKKSLGKQGKSKRGGQRGHQRQLRQPLPPERVDETIIHEMDGKEIERLGLEPSGEVEIIQHIELPQSPIYVTEHQLVVYLDADGERYVPYLPELKGPVFGPRMLAMIGWLKSVGHCSYSTIETYLEDVLQVPVSRGYLSKLCTETIADSLSTAYEEIKQAIPQQPQLGSDETSFKNNGKKHWVWCITSAAFSVFHIAQTRSRDVLERLVGTEFAGHLNFDYFSANCSFVWNYAVKGQYCWAHLIREIRFLQEKHPDKATQAWAEQLLNRSRRLFSVWHRRDEKTAESFQLLMTLNRDIFLELVRKPPSTKEAMNLAARFKTVNFISDDSPDIQQYDLSQDYFRFMDASGLEPTNNHSEQQIRYCVIDRRITQGTRGEAGQRYHERMWSAIATCRKQNRSFFDFLHASIAAKLARQPAPSLLNASTS